MLIGRTMIAPPHAYMLKVYELYLVGAALCMLTRLMPIARSHGSHGSCPSDSRDGLKPGKKRTRTGHTSEPSIVMALGAQH